MNLSPAPLRRSTLKHLAAGLGLAVLIPSALSLAANAASPAIDLGTAESFAVLGGSEVTNTGDSVITGDLGVNPGSAVTGFPPGLVIGTNYENDEGNVAAGAQDDLTLAYDDAAEMPDPVLLAAELGGQSLVPGVYTVPSSALLTGTLTLNATNNPDAVFVFQIPSTLTTAASGSTDPSPSRVELIGGNPCNVYWQVGSSATLGTYTEFVGTIMALESVTVTTGASLEGRALARNAAVTLDTNRITAPLCDDEADDGTGADETGEDGDDGTDADGAIADADADDADGTADGTDGTDTDGTDTDGTDADGTDADADGTGGVDTDAPGSDTEADADVSADGVTDAGGAARLPDTGAPSSWPIVGGLLLLVGGIVLLLHRNGTIGRHRV